MKRKIHYIKLLIRKQEKIFKALTQKRNPFLVYTDSKLLVTLWAIMEALGRNSGFESQY